MGAARKGMLKMTRSRSLSLGLLTALLLAAPMQAATPEAAATSKQAKAQATKATVLQAPIKVTSVEGITEYRLSNGMRVLLFPDPGKPTITVNVTYLVGSR